MTFVGALVLHVNDPELCLITGKVVAASRVKLQRWSNGSVRTAKEEDIVYVPIPDAVEQLRALLVADAEPLPHEVLDGEPDLVAAAYAYTSAFTGEWPLDKDGQPARRIDNLPGNQILVPPEGLSSKSNTNEQYKADFIREALIADVLMANLTVNASGEIKVWGTKVDMIRLIEIYCSTAGIRSPTKSLVLRRFAAITAFIAGKLAEPDLAFVLKNCSPPREFHVDIREMEP